MFTGIIEELGKVKEVNSNGNNRNITIRAKMAPDLKVDQSIAHNGVCLTVISTSSDSYTVTAIHETLKKTNLSTLRKGDPVNLERGMLLGARLDGHLVQGHVDQVGTCTAVSSEEGSWIFTFQYDASSGNVTIEKGSITVNGVSLTVVDSKEDEFSVAIIPYTYEHTTFQYLKVGMSVNLEFDVIGKYVSRLNKQRL